MLILQIALWTFIGLVLATVQALIMNDDRGLSVLAVAVFTATLGGVLGLQFSGQGTGSGINLIALVSAAAFCAAGLIFFDIARKPRNRQH